MNPLQGPMCCPLSEVHSGKSIVRSILQSVIEEPQEKVLAQWRDTHTQKLSEQHARIPDYTGDAYDYSQNEDYEI